MVVEGGCCEKDLKIIGRVPQMSGGIMERAIRKVKLRGERWKEETEVVRGASFTSRFDVDEIMQIGWLRFMHAIMGNENNFEFYAPFVIKPMK